MLAACLEELGGVPAVVLSDRMACLKASVVANVVVPHPDYVRFATHYGLRPDFCEAADPESKGMVEHLAGYVQGDLVVPAGGWESVAVCESTPGPTPTGGPKLAAEPTPTGGPCTPTTLTLNLTWAASGPLSSSQFSFRSHAPDCKLSEQGSQTSRSAIATGIISDGSSDFTPTPSQDASVFRVRDATLQIGDCFGPPPPGP